jgi:hypothetical protein
VSEGDYAVLALQHLHFAGQLATLFAMVSIAYLVAAWQLAGRLGAGINFLLQTLFVGWQSNVAYLAVVSLLAARTALERAGDAITGLGWALAPLMVPGAAVLYATMLLLCLLFFILRARQRSGAAHGG